MIGRVALALGLAGGMAAAGGAQQSVAIVDRGPGVSGRILEAALARPHRLVPPDSGWFRIGRAESIQTSLVVLGRTTAVEGNVNGDVIVVGGDLFVRPGARVAGRAVAIGGGVYPSALALVEGGTESLRDNTFRISPANGGFHLAYQSLRERDSETLLLPGIFGMRMPAYDRVNGLSLPFGPAFSLLGGRGELNALATYRSDLGKIDPSVELEAGLTRRLRAELFAGRGTFSNEAWIWSDFVNSFAALTSGVDTRNYYRADRAELTVHRLWEFTNVQFEPFAGGLYERAWSVGPAPGQRRGPWSLFGGADTLRMWRPNPRVEHGVIASALVGARWQYDTDDLRIRLRTLAEANGRAPSDQRFVQVTSDLDGGFPTFGEQQYRMEVRWVTTAGDTPPRQRFVYLGGSGTLPFLELLEQGGDELLLIDQRYSVPLPGVRAGLLGEVTLILRHRLGSAGIARLPPLEQTIGVGAMLTLLRAELQFDPARRRVRFSAGFSFSR